MKTKTLFILFLLLSFTVVKAQETKSETIKTFLKDVIDLQNEEISDGTPIASFNEIANSKAAKTIVLSKENIKESLADAKNYKHCVVTVGYHTIVLVADLNDCSPSGAWGACMPMAEGYIQKGTLSLKTDYMKNIIGQPDSQDRSMFLFN
jgi:hypothetical protein